MVREEILKILRSCIKRGKFQLHAGQETDWRFDIEEVPGDLQLLMMTLSPHYDLAGIDQGGAELACSLNAFSVIVYKNGMVYPSLVGFASLHPVSLVDDVVTTEASFKAAEDALLKNGYIVAERLAVLDRRNPEHKTLEIRSLVTAQDLGLDL